MRPVFPTQTVNNGIALQPDVTWQLLGEELTNFSPVTMQGQLLLNDKPPLNLARYIRELEAYPYGCLEQTASGLSPSLYTNVVQLKASGIVGDSDEKHRAAADIGISRLVQIQHDNGGFALWDKSGSEGYWLTAYIMDFLIQANEQGYSVPVEVVNRDNERLLRYLQDPGILSIHYTDDSSTSRFVIRAYAALVLARQQKAPLGALREIWKRCAQAASGLPLLRLGIALKNMGDANRSEQALTLVLSTPHHNTQQWTADYGSALRDNALMLALLEEDKLKPDAQNTLLDALPEQTFGQRQFSTQEGNALFLAARTLQDLPGTRQAQTSLSEQSLAGEKSQTRNLDADALSTLSVTNTGNQPLWLRLDVSGCPQTPSTPASNVLHIERQILGLDGDSRSLDSLHSGELVLVWLEMKTSQDVPGTLMVDLLPTGLELENQNLANGSVSLQGSGSKVANLLDQMQQADIQHVELRDDRFVAAMVINEGQPVTLVYLARAAAPRTHQVPVP